MEFPRLLAELGYSKSPMSILNLLRQTKPLTLEFLDGKETCSELQLGELLGEGKSGSVFTLVDNDNEGLEVVLKKFEAREAPTKIKENKTNGKILYILSSSLNEIVMSSIFNSFYDGGYQYCISFPYFEGFFVCGSDGYSITEKLDDTMSKFFLSDKFSVESFRSVMFQIFYAIKFLVKNKIVHNDMHGKNAMIRGTEGIAYRGATLNDYDYFSYTADETVYSIPNIGIIAKIMDLDFACKYSDPQVCPKKVYEKIEDNWNLQFRFSSSYDTLVFAAYMVYYTHIKSAVRENKQAKTLVESLSKFIVQQAEKELGKSIPKLGHLESGNRSYAAKLLDMVDKDSYRPAEEYCHLDLSNILNIDIFNPYKNPSVNSLSVAEM